MAGRYDQAEILVAFWKLGACAEMIPTSHGILDRALQAVKGRLPVGVSPVTFSATGVGLRCFEFPDIPLAAQEAILTNELNPTYLSTVINLRDQEAAEIAVMHGSRINDAVAIGKALKEGVERAKTGWQSKMVA